MMHLLVGHAFLHLSAHQHYCLFLVHKGAYELGFYHWGFTPWNINIILSWGYLIDWDLVKSTNINPPSQATCMVCSPTFQLCAMPAF